MAFLRTIAPLMSSVITSLALLSTAVAQSTIDPSSALLLNAPSRSAGRSSEKATSETRNDSTRYTVRPRAASERSEKAATTTQSTSQTTTVRTATPVSTPAPTPAPVVLAPSEKGAVVVVMDPPLVEPAIVEVRDPQPTGKHILEVSIATAYLYENAESNYSYRQATMGGPAYVASARAWLFSEFAVGGRFLSTLGGQVADRGQAKSAGRTEIVYGVYLRKKFAESNLIFAAEYVDSEFKVSSDVVSKLKTRSSGVRVSIESEFQSQSSSWSLGFSVMPKLQHEEISAATEVRSGTSVNAYSVGASITRSWKFNTSNAVFVKLEHRLERDLFTGSATLPDPIGGATPNGVAATVGTTLIQFGYGWGD